MKAFKLIDHFDKEVMNHYIITFFFSAIGAIINFYFFRKVYLNIGEDSFYYYSYARRIISFLSPVLILGLAISLPRHMAKSCDEQKNSLLLFTAASIILLFVSLLWLFLNLICIESLTRLLWGVNNEFTRKLNIAISLYLISLNVAAGVHSYFRGKINTLAAGILDLMVQSIIPLISFLIFRDLIKIYYSISILVIILTLVTTLSLIKNSEEKSFQCRKLLNEGKILLDYGLRRIPGDMSYALLIFLPSYFASHFFDIKLAGIISLGSSLLTLFNLPASAISFVTLSRSSSLLFNRKDVLFKETKSLVIAGIGYSLLILTIAYFFLDYFLKFFFDQNFVKYTDTIFLILLTLPFLVIFTLLRSIIDSAYKRAYNSFFIFIALVIIALFSVFAIWKSNPDFLIYGNTAAYFSLTLLTYLLTFKTLKK